LHVIRLPNQPVRRLSANVHPQSPADPQQRSDEHRARAIVAAGSPTVIHMQTELPAERLRRRLGAQPSTAERADHDADDSDAADTDPNSLLPRWLPDGSAQSDGWFRKVRADPGRAGLSRWPR